MHLTVAGLKRSVALKQCKLWYCIPRIFHILRVPVRQLFLCTSQDRHKPTMYAQNRDKPTSKCIVFAVFAIRFARALPSACTQFCALARTLPLCVSLSLCPCFSQNRNEKQRNELVIKYSLKSCNKIYIYWLLKKVYWCPMFQHRFSFSLSLHFCFVCLVCLCLLHVLPSMFIDVLYCTLHHALPGRETFSSSTLYCVPISITVNRLM